MLPLGTTRIRPSSRLQVRIKAEYKLIKIINNNNAPMRKIGERGIL